MEQKGGILITRTDRIGDVVLCLPVIRTLRKIFPNEPIHMMVSSYAYPVVENYPGLSSVISYEPEDNSPNYVPRTRQLVQHLKELEINAALMLVYDPEVLAIIKRAGIKKRFGPLTKIGAGMFSYKWDAQHRSKVDHHELEYNLLLLKLLGIKDTVFDTTLDLPVPRANVLTAFEKLRNIGFDSPEHGYFIIHPGCGDSAKNWRYSFYAELANRLCSSLNIPLVLTGTDKEADILNSIKQHVRDAKVYSTAGILSLKDLIATISEAKLFVGPSTGPMHIATATGVPVTAIFSPVKVQSARRWGPYSYNNSVVVAPSNIDCPGTLKCLGNKCEYFECMDMISVDEVFDKAMSLYEKSVGQMGLSFTEV